MLLKALIKKNHDKGKISAIVNFRWRFENKKSFYTNEDSNGLSNGEEVESDQQYQLITTFEGKCIYDVFMDALDEKCNVIKEIT